MSVDDDVRTFLGLGPSDPLVPIAVDDRRAGVARAFRVGDLEPLRARPQVEQVLPELPFGVFRLKREPDVVVVAVEALTASAGPVERWPGGWALDGRSATAMARWSDGEGERALVNDRGRVSVFEVAREVSGFEVARAAAPAVSADASAGRRERAGQADDTAAVGGGDPDRAASGAAPAGSAAGSASGSAAGGGTLSCPVPTPGELARDAERWLVDRADALRRSTTPARTAAAVGLFGRLATDPEPARAWALALPPADRERVGEDALRQVGACRDRLERVSLAAVNGEDAGPALLELVDLRDVLASAAWVLRPPYESLEQALVALDREVEIRWSELPEAPPELGDLCAEVAWREPWAWWGHLA